MSSYYERQQQLEDRLKPMLTDEFLETLVECCRSIGHGVDLVEVQEFVRCCYDIRYGEEGTFPVDKNLEPYNP